VCGATPAASASASASSLSTFPDISDIESLDDVINLVNTLRFLCVNKWSALGDSFLACSVAGSPSKMQTPMLNTRKNNVYWNEEWLD
jgi:hypothetical protein